MKLKMNYQMNHHQWNLLKKLILNLLNILFKIYKTFFIVLIKI